VLFMGKCGGLKKKNADRRPGAAAIAAIRGRGTSNDYLLARGARDARRSQLQRAVSTMTRDLGHDYWTGTVYTTNRRVWEHDDAFQGIHCARPAAWRSTMETATDLRRGLRELDPTGALLLVSDQPMIPEGVKTEFSDRIVTENFVETHVQIGIEALKLIRRHGKSVKHLRFDE
jgi:AMP nucleosidase